MELKNLKYLAVGIVVGYVGLYVFSLANAKFSTSKGPEAQEEINKG